MKFASRSMVPYRQILLEHKFASGFICQPEDVEQSTGHILNTPPPKEMWPVMKYSVTTLVKVECL